MSRTLAGNLTGNAAHGHDEIMDEPTPYAVRLNDALNNLKSVITPEHYAQWIIGRLDYRGEVSMLNAAIALYAEYALPVDPRTPAQIEHDEAGADWQNQVNEHRG